MNDRSEAHSKGRRLLDESASLRCAQCAYSEVRLSECRNIVNPENWKTFQSLRTSRSICILDEARDLDIQHVGGDVCNLHRERTCSKYKEPHSLTSLTRSWL